MPCCHKKKPKAHIRLHNYLDVLFSRPTARFQMPHLSLHLNYGKCMLAPPVRVRQISVNDKYATFLCKRSKGRYHSLVCNKACNKAKGCGNNALINTYLVSSNKEALSMMGTKRY